MNRILIVGYGSIGKRHVRNILNYTNSNIIIFTKRSDLDFKTNRVTVSDSLDYCLLQKPNIGFICNETSFHVSTALQLAKAGLDLFLEKPLSDSIKGVNDLKRIVNKKRLITQMGYHMRFHDCIIKIRKLIKQKKIGRVISIQSENGSYFPDWHPYEDYTKSYAGKKRLGGGIILTQIHDIDYLYWFFGKPKSIFSFAGKLSDLKITSEDYSASIIQFPNRVTVELHLDFFQGPEYRRCKIKGTNGIIEWNSNENKIKFFNNKKKKWEIILNFNTYERNQLYIDEIKHFFKCVKTRKKTINPLEEGIKTLNIALAMKKSSETKKLIDMK